MPPILRHLQNGAVFAESFRDIYDIRQRFTVSGNPSIVESHRGRGILLDGSADLVRKSTPNFRIGDSQGTIIAGIKPNDVSGNKAIFTSSDEASANDKLIFRIGPNGQLLGGTNTGGTWNYVTGDTVLVAGSYYSTAFISNGSLWSMFVNDHEESLSVVGANNGRWFADVSNRDNFAIGARYDSGGASNYFKGEILYLIIWKRVLSLDEITDVWKGEAWGG